MFFFPPKSFRAYFSPSPSGCTFWGKKPWSRKKKILWQLGTLVGAPVGIALIAGIAIPAMIIGIPVYVGRKVRLWKHVHVQYYGTCIQVFLFIVFTTWMRQNIDSFGSVTDQTLPAALRLWPTPRSLLLTFECASFQRS